MAFRRTESTQEAFVNKNSHFTATAVFFCVILLIGLVVAVPQTWGQQASGSITGSVTDTSGAAVSNATVTARDIARGTTLTTQTNGSGAYTFPQLTVGQ